MGLSIHPHQFLQRPPLFQYLAPLGAKYLEKRQKNYKKSIDFCIFLAFYIGIPIAANFWRILRLQFAQPAGLALVRKFSGLVVLDVFLLVPHREDFLAICTYFCNKFGR